MSTSSEQVAIVAGAGGELGRAVAQKLAAAGYTVAGIDRSEEGLKELPDGPVAVICEGGYRSALASSLLAHEGVRELVNVVDGMTGYRNATSPARDSSASAY